MTVSKDELKAITPASAFYYDGVFSRSFKPLQTALNEQFKRLNRDNKRFDAVLAMPLWITQAGKGGPGYEQYRTVSLARHCLDVMFLATLTAFVLWKSRALEPDIAVDDEAAFERALTRLLVIALFHDADKYRGVRSRSPSREDIEVVYKDLALATYLNITPAEIAALVSRVESRGQADSFLSVAISPLDNILASIVALADSVIGDAARSAVENPDLCEEQALVDGYAARIKGNFAIELPAHKVHHLRQNPAVLHEIQLVLLEEIPARTGLPPLVLSVAGEQLTFSLPESLPVEELLEVVRTSLDRRKPTCKLVPNDGKITVSHINDVDDLLSAVSGMSDPQADYLLRIHINDQPALSGFIESWAGNHGPDGLTVNERPESGKVYRIFTLKEIKADDFNQPLTRAFCMVVLLRGGVKNPTKEFDNRVNTLRKLLEECATSSLATLETMFGQDAFQHFDMATRQTLIALQVAADIIDGDEFKGLIEIFIDRVFVLVDATEEDAGTQMLIRNLAQQLGSSFVQEDELLPYQAHPSGGTCLLCGTPTDVIYKPSETTIPGSSREAISKTAFSNRIGHCKDVYSESIGKTYICPSCVKAYALLGHQFTVSGRKFQPGKENILHTSTPLRSLILPGMSSQAGSHRPTEKPLRELISSWDVVGKDPVAVALQVLPWNLDLSGSVPLYIDTLESGLANHVSYLLNAARFAWLSGNPVYVFQVHQHQGKGAFMAESVPALVDDLLRANFYPNALTLTIDRQQLPSFIECLTFINTLLQHKDNANLSVLNDIRLYGWWPVAWFVYRAYMDEVKGLSLTGQRMLELARRSFAMPEIDTPLYQLAKHATHIQRRPRRGAAASGSLQGLAFDTALTVFQEFHLKQGASRDDTVAAMIDQVNDVLSRREAYAGGEDVMGRYRQFAENAYDLFDLNCRDGDLNAKTRRYLRAAYITYFLEIHEANKSADKTVTDSNHQQALEL